MSENRSHHRNVFERHPVNAERQCCLRLVSCKDLTWKDYCFKIVDLSVTGIGVESDVPIDSGLIWFKTCVYGQKFGYPIWQAKKDNRYRIGIAFISLGRTEEQYFRQHLEKVEQGRSVHDPDNVISIVLQNVQQQYDSIL
jgi:hypothetical protein